MRYFVFFCINSSKWGLILCRKRPNNYQKLLFTILQLVKCQFSSDDLNHWICRNKVMSNDEIEEFATAHLQSLTTANNRRKAWR